MGNRDCDGESLCGKQKLKISSHDYQPLDSVFASSQAKYYLASGSRTMLNFGAVGGVNRSGNGRSFDQEESGDEYLDEYFSQPEKKRRLSVDQVQFLERSFEAENKLEPERRTQLAKDLGLQPRQVAIWFQNRRARWKTRQLETDYETLHSSYKKLKTDYDNLMKENEMLKTEVLHLKQNGLPQGTEKANPKELHEAMPNEAIPDMISEDGEANVSELAFKDEEQSSVKSDSNNLDSPWLTNGINSSQLESGDSSHFLEPGQSGLSQNGEDDFKGELFQLDYIVPKIEDARCHQPPSSFYYGFPVEDHAFSFWSY